MIFTVKMPVVGHILWIRLQPLNYWLRFLYFWRSFQVKMWSMKDVNRTTGRIFIWNPARLVKISFWQKNIFRWWRRRGGRSSRSHRFDPSFTSFELFDSCWAVVWCQRCWNEFWMGILYGMFSLPLVSQQNATQKRLPRSTLSPWGLDIWTVLSGILRYWNIFGVLIVNFSLRWMTQKCWQRV